MFVDVVIPTRNQTDIRNDLLSYISREDNFNQLIIVEGQPTSFARRNGCLKSSSQFVAMFDDDMQIPSDWLNVVAPEIESADVGAVSTVHKSADKDVAAYCRIVSLFIKLANLETAGRIGNILIRRFLMHDYKPTLLSDAEEQHLMKYVKSRGYKWKTIPYIGVVHMRRSTITVETGIHYKRLHAYSLFQLTKRLISRFVLGGFTPFISRRLKSSLNLWSNEVKFLSGWLKEACRSH